MGITQQIGASSLIKPGVIDSAAARPASPFEGQVIFQKDTDQLLVWNGTAWVIPNSPAQNPMGLELVTTCTVTSAGGTSATASGGVVTIGAGNTSVTVANAFSATYDSYKIIINGGASSAQVGMYMQIGGSAGSYYGFYTYGTYGAATVYGANTNNGSSAQYIGGCDIGMLHLDATVTNPFLAMTTGISGSMGIWGNNRGSSAYDHEVSTSFSSFVIGPLSGTITGGTLRVYGYRK